MNDTISTMDAKKMHQQPGQERAAIKRNASKREKMVNRFGMTGYFFGMLQWLMVFALYFTWIQVYFIAPMQPTPAPAAEPPQNNLNAQPADDASLFVIIGLVVFVVIMVAATVYAFAKIPGMVARAGSRTVRAVAEQSAPVALKARRLPETKNNQLKMSARFVVAIKGVMIILPIILAGATHFIAEQVMPVGVAIWSALVLAVPTTLFFAIQYVSAKFVKVSITKLV